MMPNPEVLGAQVPLYSAWCLVVFVLLSMLSYAKRVFSILKKGHLPKLVFPANAKHLFIMGEGEQPCYFVGALPTLILQRYLLLLPDICFRPKALGIMLTFLICIYEFRVYGTTCSHFYFFFF